MIRKTLGVVACLSIWGLSFSALAQTDPNLLRSIAPDRAAKLAAAAKAEGAITLYTSIAEKDLKPLIEPFEKKYGVKVSTWRASGDSVRNRTLNETKAKRYNVDVVHAGAVELEVLHREKMLQAVASPHFADLMPGSVPAHKEYATTIYSMWVQAYNTGAVKKTDLPKTYQDLLDPKWKGRLGYEVENIDWFVTVVLPFAWRSPAQPARSATVSFSGSRRAKCSAATSPWP